MTETTTTPWCRTCEAPLLQSGGCAFCGEGDAVEADPAPASRYLRPVEHQSLPPARKEYRLSGEVSPSHAALIAELSAARRLAEANGDALARCTAEAGRLREALRAVVWAGRDVMQSYEAFCAVTDPRPEEEWDEYDYMMMPAWRAFAAALPAAEAALEGRP